MTHRTSAEVGAGDPEFSPDVSLEAQDAMMEAVNNIEEVGAKNEKEAGSKVAESIERALTNYISMYMYRWITCGPRSVLSSALR